MAGACAVNVTRESPAYAEQSRLPKAQMALGCALTLSANSGVVVARGAVPGATGTTDQPVPGTPRPTPQSAIADSTTAAYAVHRRTGCRDVYERRDLMHPRPGRPPGCPVPRRSTSGTFAGSR